MDQTKTVLESCGDCEVPPGQPHVDGCHVAQCLACGWQRIGCGCPEDAGWGQVWTGIYPGYAECREYGWTASNDRVTPGIWPDINKFDALTRQGLMVWNGTRWTLTPYAKGMPGIISPTVLLPHRVIEAIPPPYGEDGERPESEWHYECSCGFIEQHLADEQSTLTAFRRHAGWES